MEKTISGDNNYLIENNGYLQIVDLSETSGKNRKYIQVQQ